MLIGSNANAQCSSRNAGTMGCPMFTAPATVAVPNPSMGGTIPLNGGAQITLFNGAIPPNGFMVQLNNPLTLGNFCFINDNGPAKIIDSLPPTGFMIGWYDTSGHSIPNMFTTPPGYKPIGPVNVMCTGGTIYIEVRGW
jgi:hypothetical protein